MLLNDSCSISQIEKSIRPILYTFTREHTVIGNYYVKRVAVITFFQFTFTKPYFIGTNGDQEINCFHSRLCEYQHLVFLYI
jgi:hypothetical protein